MTWIFIVIGIICVGAIIACYNHVEKLHRIIEERQEDLTRAKAEAERKENKLLVSFSKQTSELRQKLEDTTTDLQITKAQWEWMSKEKTALTTERDQWKAQAEQAASENKALQTFQADATEEIAQLKATLAALQTEKAEWEERYQAESQQWSQQKRELVNQIRPTTALSMQVAPIAAPAPFESVGILFTEEGMVLGERSSSHPDQLTNALIYEGKTEIHPLLERTRRESTLYPALYQPGNGVPVLIPSPIQPIVAQGMVADLRGALQKALSSISGIQLLDTVALPIRNRTYGYIPAIALYVESGHFYVDIEVDTPLSETGQSIHYQGSTDQLRNLYFLENGWAVFRFAEQQVAEHKVQIVDLILQQLAVLTDRPDLDREVDMKGIWLNRWSCEETAEVITTPEDFHDLLPDIDILVDHSARCQKGIEKVKGHPYTKVTLHNDYEYVFVADSIKCDIAGYERGWTITDVIEQQKVFIPFSEIVSISYLDSLWLSPELVIGEEFAMEEWEQLGKGLKEAAYGARPIHIQYQPKEGAAVEQDVLYLSHYFTQQDTGEIIPWEQTAPLLFEESYLHADFQEFAGYSLTTQETQLFAAYQIKRFCLYNCHKPGACYNETDLWSCFEAGLPEIARQLYQLFHEEKRQQVAALSEQSGYKEAIAHLQSQQA